jgi:hypothetical protein
MSAEPETTLAWAEFLWRVVKDAPPTVIAYLLLLDYLRHRQQAGKQGRLLTLELSDSATASDSLTMTIGPATEVDTARPVRITKRVTIGPAIEHDIALPIKVVGGAPA